MGATADLTERDRTLPTGAGEKIDWGGGGGGGVEQWPLTTKNCMVLF